MSLEGGPVFLAKRAYYKRRMTDAARLLPVLGVGLLVLPLLWNSSETGEGMRTVHVMFYLFLVWIFLAGAAGLISRRLSVKDDEDSASDAER